MKYKILFLIIPIVVLLAGAGLGFAYYKHEQNEKKDVVPASDLVAPEDSASTNTTDDQATQADDVPANTNTATTNTATKTSATTNTSTKPANANTSTPAPTNTTPTKQPGTYTVAEVQAANTASKCWTVIRGKVYDLTSYLNAHPGGKANIMQVCGKDGTATFDSQHSGQGKPEDKLASLYLGILVK